MVIKKQNQEPITKLTNKKYKKGCESIKENFHKMKKLKRRNCTDNSNRNMTQENREKRKEYIKRKVNYYKSKNLFNDLIKYIDDIKKFCW